MRESGRTSRGMERIGTSNRTCARLVAISWVLLGACSSPRRGGGAPRRIELFQPRCMPGGAARGLAALPLRGGASEDTAPLGFEAAFGGVGVCLHDQCVRDATYGPSGTTLRLYCRLHRKPPHVLVADAAQAPPPARPSRPRSSLDGDGPARKSQRCCEEVPSSQMHAPGLGRPRALQCARGGGVNVGVRAGGLPERRVLRRRGRRAAGVQPAQVAASHHLCWLFLRLLRVRGVPVVCGCSPCARVAGARGCSTSSTSAAAHPAAPANRTPRSPRYAHCMSFSGARAAARWCDPRRDGLCEQVLRARGPPCDLLHPTQAARDEQRHAAALHGARVHETGELRRAGWYPNGLPASQRQLARQRAPPRRARRCSGHRMRGVERGRARGGAGGADG